MSSEAAQKAYPVERQYALSGLIAREQQEAFDRGAVEALRRAADKIALYRVRENPEEWSSVFVLMDFATEQAREWLKAESEEWEAGQ